MNKVQFTIGDLPKLGSYIELNSHNLTLTLDIDGNKKSTKLNILEAWFIKRIFNRLK